MIKLSKYPGDRGNYFVIIDISGCWFDIETSLNIDSLFVRLYYILKSRLVTWKQCYN